VHTRPSGWRGRSEPRPHRGLHDRHVCCLARPCIPGGQPSAVASDPQVVATLISGQELQSEVSNPQTADERHDVEQAFLQNSANDGRLYDAAEVDTAVIGDTSVAWPNAVDVSKVITASDSSTGAVGLGVVASNNPSSGDQTLARLGSETLKGAYGQRGDPAGGTVEVWNGGFKIVSGWDRWRVKESKTDREIYHYYYGHWTTAYGHYQTGFDPAPYIVESASRPKQGYRDTFLQLRNYWPKTDTPSCNSSGDLSISVLGFGGSLPMQNCSSLRTRSF
jgi:hypothetical protein